MMPVTDVFEAELDILDLLEYKPIISKGYHCMMHIHTHAGEVTISHIVKSFEKNDRGEVTEKQKPQFARGQTKIICRMNPTNPVSLEKFETIQQMGRFTLRDDGKTICVGKVLKYKPYNKSASAAQGQVAALAKKLDSTQISSSSEPVKGEVVMNLETGEVKEKAKPLGAIAEGEEEAD
jgi:sulfate adenylyltransferase subunit 1 (EFTu-like GTPase family)